MRARSTLAGFEFTNHTGGCRLRNMLDLALQPTTS
jgi:hypothetical protein